MSDHGNLDLAPPPRRVPLLVRAALLSGDEVGAPGWVLLGIAMIFFYPWPFCAGPFVAIGLACVITGLLRGAKASRLLANGLLGLGTLKSRKVVKYDSQGNEFVCRLTFEFVAHDGNAYEVATNTTETKVLEDQEYEGLVYDPRKPSRAVLMDNLPASPRIDAAGNVDVGNRAYATFALVLPPVVILGHGIYALIRYSL
jgi:hypothetical protein